MSWTAPGVTVTLQVRRVVWPPYVTAAVTDTTADLPDSWPAAAVTLAPEEPDSRRAEVPPDQDTEAPAGRPLTVRVTLLPTWTAAVWGRVGTAAGVTVTVQASW